MPYLKIQTNLPLTKKAERNILKHASILMAEELNKSEDYVMVAIEHDTSMLFAGTDDPLAFLELKSIGLPVRSTKRLCAALSLMMDTHLGIPKSRVYVRFINVAGSMWGWNGDTF
jgi:phenylpyruvate tautomerase PptA (4-oxalocrotonate tautomerase family)